MNIEEDIKGLPADLIEVELANKDEVVHGKGLLSMKANGLIEFKLYVDNPKEATIEDKFMAIGKWNKGVGKLIPAEEYYILNAVSLEGYHYSCQRVLIRNYNDFKVYDGDLCADLIITPDDESVNYTIARVVIPYVIKLPRTHVINTENKYSDKWSSRTTSLEVFEIVTENYVIDIFPHSGSTVVLVQIHDSSNLQDLIPLVLETLEFIIACIINRYVIEYEYKGSFKRVFHYSHDQLPKITHGKSPLTMATRTWKEYHSELFVKYLKYIQASGHEKISQTLHMLISSQNSFITSYALTVTVAVETLLLSHFSSKHYGKPKRGVIKQINAEINKTLLDDSIKARICGMIGNLFGQVRADDILRDLVKQNTLHTDLYTKWKKLRNEVHHGRDPDCDLQEYIYLCDTNLVLYYRLIFILIDYKGVYTDYSSPGYPEILISDENKPDRKDSI